MKHRYKNIDIPLYRGFGEFDQYSILVDGDKSINSIILDFYGLFDLYNVDIVDTVLIVDEPDRQRMWYCSDWMSSSVLPKFVDRAIELGVLKGIRFSDRGIMGPSLETRGLIMLRGLASQSDLIVSMGGEMAVVEIPSSQSGDDLKSSKTLKEARFRSKTYKLVSMLEELDGDLETHWMLSHGAVVVAHVPPSTTPDLSKIL